MKTPSVLTFLGYACFLTTGCTTTPLAPARTVHFTCDNGPPLSVVFEGETATVTPQGSDPITLPQAASGSGFLYMTPQHSLRGKGDEVTWTVGRMVPVQCKLSG